MPCPATTWRGSTRSRSLGDQLRDSKETHNKTKNEDIDKARRSPLRDLPERLEEFNKISWTKKLPHQAMHPQAFLVNHFVKILREQWYRSQHSIFTRIPKDRCCEVCEKTEITRAQSGKRTGNQVPRKEKFGDLIAADHQVLSEKRESRDNQRYAVEVQHSATQWKQSYPYKKFSRDGTEFTKVSRTAVLLQSGLDETWWADSMKCYRYLQNVQEFLSSSETPCKRRFGDPFNKWAHNSLRMIEYHPLSAQDQSRLLQFRKQFLPGIFLRYALHARGVWKGDILVADVDVLENKGMTGVPDPVACWTDPRSLCGAQGRIP